MNKKTGTAEAAQYNSNPAIRKYIAQNMFLQSTPPMTKRKHRHPAAIAASILLILILSGIFAVFLLHNTSEGYRNIDETDSISLTIHSLEDFNKIKNFFPEIFVPDQVPGEFHFEALTVTRYSETYHAEYTYESEKGIRLTIRQETFQGETLTAVIDSADEIKTEDGRIYILKKKQKAEPDSFSYYRKGTVIDILGHLEKEEALKIYGLKQNSI